MTVSTSSRVPVGAAGRVYLATLAAYLTADFIAPISGSILAGLDPGALVVPFCAAFAVAFPLWGRAADRHPAGLVLGCSLLALAVGGVLLALAPSTASVIAASALQGAAAAVRAATAPRGGAAAGVPPPAEALLASRAGNASAGKAVSGMMVMVAV